MAVRNLDRLTLVVQTSDGTLLLLNSTKPRLPILLQSGLAHPFDEFGHWSRRIRDVALDPRDGEIGMRFFQPGKSLARLVDLAVLRQAGAVNAMTRGECRTLLQSFAALFDRFGKASGEIMGNGETRIENRILRVVRAHPDRLLQMRDRLFGLAAKCERPAEIAVRSGE